MWYLSSCKTQLHPLAYFTCRLQFWELSCSASLPVACRLRAVTALGQLYKSWSQAQNAAGVFPYRSPACSTNWRRFTISEYSERPKHRGRNTFGGLLYKTA